ncbi:EscU/YscU/HrcU family type III secretion system export apparatus switch protein [Paraburkholderia adhaesiva]|uniref:EscU/YscU/HrcU family type III secretion system export apparatus switch protein n=1 Tax=Paraburkholderia adhaesiva TaxID=2883244 RepID=UPI001F17C4AB|nr:EscU/YscU/HrcU family type III secretion system export apparatus switch protein [Paraburkholderia adhaesiva]
MSRMHRKTAAVLAYDTPAATDGAPRVVAKGYGIVADTIIQRAKEAGLYVHQSPEMVRLLMQVDLDSKIPPQLYQAVAELLAWLHGLEAADKADAAQPAEPAPATDTSPSAAVPRIARRVGALPPPPFRTSSSD